MSTYALSPETGNPILVADDPDDETYIVDVEGKAGPQQIVAARDAEAAVMTLLHLGIPAIPGSARLAFGRAIPRTAGDDIEAPERQRHVHTADCDHEPDPEAKAAYAKAAAYARDWDETWSAFMTDMRNIVTHPQGRRLTPGQVAGILKVKAAVEAKAAQQAKAPAPQTDLDLSALPDGTTRVAVPGADGKLAFYKLDKVADKSSRWLGWIFAKQVIGGSDEDGGQRVGSQRPGQRYTGQHVELLRRALADLPAAAARFGQEIGACARCGRTLTDEDSRQMGIGPDCAAKGW